MRILSLMYFFLTFNFLIFIVFLAFTRLSIVIISVTEMQWHKCMFKHKKNNSIFVSPGSTGRFKARRVHSYGFCQ